MGQSCLSRRDVNYITTLLCLPVLWKVSVYACERDREGRHCHDIMALDHCFRHHVMLWPWHHVVGDIRLRPKIPCTSFDH